MSCNGLGILLSTEPVQQKNGKNIDRIPQILMLNEIWNNEWTKYTYQYVADSSYQYLTFGNFLEFDDIDFVDYQYIKSGVKAKLAYYFIDEFWVERTDPNIQGDTMICEGDAATFFAHNYKQTGWYSDQMELLSTDDSIVLEPSLTTSYYLMSEFGLEEFTVHVIPKQFNELGNDTLICEGDILPLHTKNQYSAYEWSDGSRNKEFEVDSPGKYWVMLTTANCISTDTLNIQDKLCECSPLIPNSFTPNSDGLNEELLPIFNCPIKDYQMTIFNRWGEIIYESNQVERGWDGVSNGSQIIPGQFVYIIKYSLANSQDFVLRGSINIIK